MGASRVRVGDVEVDFGGPPQPRVVMRELSPEERQEMARREAEEQTREAERVAMWSAS